MIKTFLLGLIIGATAIWVLKDSIDTGIDTRTRTIRAATAHRLRAATGAIERGMAPAPTADAPTGVARAS